jgi:hypothetical protein
MGQQRVAQQAISAGAFGGGREGVQRAEAERARLSEIGLAQGRAFQGALGAFQQGQQLQAQTGLAAGQMRMAQASTRCSRIITSRWFRTRCRTS